jgi:hypothetical protein
MDYMYEELSDDRHLEMKQHLESCSACRQELGSLQSTSRIMQTWADDEPAQNLRFVKQPTRLSEFMPRWSGMRRWVFGTAIACAAVLVVLSLVNLRASYSDGEFALQMSLLPKQEPAEPTEPNPDDLPVTRAEFDQWQQDSFQMMNAMLQENETQQNRRFGTILANFANDVEKQRQQDLRFVGQGLETFRWSNQREIRRSAEALQQLILTNTQARPGQQRIENNE